MKDLATASKEEQEKFLNSFDYFLTDIDGVLLWRLIKVIPGSVPAINSLRKIGKKVVFVSNNCRSTDIYYKQLLKYGYGLEKNDLTIPTHAIIDYLKEINMTKQIYVIGMSPIKTELQEAGFKISEELPDRIEETVPAILECIKDDKNIGAVILEADINLSFIKLQKAAVYLKRKDVVFILGAPDKKLPVDPNENIFLIGPGYFIHPIEDFTGRKGHCLAKPDPNLNKYLVKKYQIKDPSRVLFVGDSILEDMGFATNCGYQKLLVLTGFAHKDHIENWTFPEEFKPHYYVESLSVLYDIIHTVFGHKL